MRAGIYEHYKGPLYLVIGMAHDANEETLARIGEPVGTIRTITDRKLVVYIPLQLDGSHAGPRMAVRDIDDFFAMICASPDCQHYGNADGGRMDFGRACGTCGNTLRQRFEYVSQEYIPTEIKAVGE